MSSSIDSSAIQQVFTEARTHSFWQDKPVPDALLTELYDLVKLGPTSANCGPARLIFVRTPEGKERLKPALSSGNLDKTMSAPVTAILAFDNRFYEHLPDLFPHADARAWFTGNEAFAQKTALQNSSIQAGYLILAARALGLDAGPMGGFDADKVNAEFLNDRNWSVNMLINLGYGQSDKLHDRLPRLSLEQAVDFC
ncbi:malonic semialdehyde reductase [Saccharospirillum sp. MSK14-1]|uniref:malonic semialdehyde reductase n=1 Tax=Saccharospirillum sp. MSK14-1 TaxID=1897632 RepID=UPI000D3D23E5|nr:malonic semialdehyde reductase [Saccharospirillum sp. MSK14-1]PTY37430.1 malonic semialdehyde reductase [Saccharospirillum sp. MSK14-1]